MIMVNEEFALDVHSILRQPSEFDRGKPRTLRKQLDFVGRFDHPAQLRVSLFIRVMDGHNVTVLSDDCIMPLPDPIWRVPILVELRTKGRVNHE